MSVQDPETLETLPWVKSAFGERNLKIPLSAPLEYVDLYLEESLYCYEVSPSVSANRGDYFTDSETPFGRYRCPGKHPAITGACEIDNETLMVIQEIKTKRLVLRPIAMTDHDAMVSMILSDSEVMRWLPGTDAAATAQDQRKLASAYLEDFIAPWEETGYGIWAIHPNDRAPGTPGSFMGYCGFISGKIEGAGPEVAYALGRPFWGSGLMTEALIQSLQWIFTLHPVPKVYAVTEPQNFGSKRVMEKAGMIHEKDVDLYASAIRDHALLPL